MLVIFLYRAMKLAKRILHKITASSAPRVSSQAKIIRRKLVTIGTNTEVREFVVIQAGDDPIVIGDFTQINPCTVIYGGSIIIGNNVMIGPQCMIASGNHDFRQTSVPMRFAGFLSKGPIHIEDNVWIGAQCVITDGVRIGTESVVAAGSVVTKDVLPYDIVAGVPAKVIGNRLKSLF